MSGSSAKAASTARNPWLILVLVCLAQFMVVLDATITNVALPSIKADLGFTDADLQWVINSYTLVFGGFLLLGGRAADLFGVKRLFVTGVVVFSVASLINGLATSSGMLIGGRALQGLGAALVSPAALSIVTTTFAEGAPRRKALGVWTAIAVGGAAVGLLVGGILTEYLAWEWIFFVNVPIGAFAIVWALRALPESRREGARGFDLLGALSVTGGLLLLVYGIVEAQKVGWTSLQTILVIGSAVALLVGFLMIEIRSAHPLIRLGIFRNRALASANGVLLAVTGGMFSIFFFASLYVQDVLRFTPVEAGLAFLPVTLGIIVASAIAQPLIAKIGVKTVAVFGMVVAGGGLMMLAFVPVDGSYATDLLPGLSVMSLGLGFTFMPLTLMATSGVQADDAGLASGLYNTSQQIGGALGLAVLSTFAASRTETVLADVGGSPTAAQSTSAAVEGFQVAFAIGSGLMLLGAVLLAVLVRRRHVVQISAAEPVPVGV